MADRARVGEEVFQVSSQVTKADCLNRHANEQRPSPSNSLHEDQRRRDRPYQLGECIQSTCVNLGVVRLHTHETEDLRQVVGD